MMVDKKYVTWSEAVEAVTKISGVMNGLSRIDDIDHVVGVARGGLPMAVMLSHELDAQMAAVWATHYDGQDQRDEVEVENYGLAKVGEGDTVLLVDDVVDTGKTLDKITTKWDEQDVLGDLDYYTAVWHEKPGPIYRPTVAVEEIDRWVVYPWESPRATPADDQ